VLAGADALDPELMLEEPELMPDEEPELMPVEERELIPELDVPHAARTSAHARGMLHFNMPFSLNCTI
jgi:hypothetical protein